MNNLQDIIWCPIDLPPIPNSVRDLETTEDWADWMFLKLTEKRPTPYDITTFTQYALEFHPELVKWIEQFPFKSIRNIKFNIQKSEVQPHIDFSRPHVAPDLYQNNKLNEPCGYRVLLKGTRQGNLYILKNNEKVYVNMPDDTDTYVLRHTGTIHGVDFEPGRQVLFLHFEINAEEHIKLLEQSFNKYKEYTITL